MQAQILAPAAVLVVWSLIMLFWMAGVRLPALKKAGIDGPGGISFDDYELTQGVGVACLIFILFSGGMDTSWQAVRRMVRPA